MLLSSCKIAAAAVFTTLALSMAAPAAAQTISFAAAITIPIGTSAPRTVAVGDFNGDGKLDFATANLGGKNVTRLLGNGDGTFGAPLTVFTSPTASAPAAIVAADFDGDGKLDLAVANGNDDKIYVLRGNGDGSFVTSSQPSALDASSVFHTIAVGDFDGNGKLDLAITNSTAKNVSILLGNGDGTFTASTLPIPNFALSIVAADFDGDGKLDLAIADASTVWIFPGLGDGTFDAGIDIQQGSTPIFLAVGDFNRDGVPDLAIASNSSKKVFIRLGTGHLALGAASFAAATNFNAPSTPQFISSADFNGDGKLDLAVTFGGAAFVVRGQGDGTFTGGKSFAVRSGLFSAAGDFNGDGRPDLLVANFRSVNVSLLLNASAFNFGGDLAPKTDFALTADAVLDPATDPLGIVTADFNNDGKLDLAVANSGTNNVSILLGSGTGSFTLASASPFDAGTGAAAVAAGDFNGDGVLDLAVANSGAGTVSIFIGNGDGSFAAASTPTVTVGSAPVAIAVGDFDGDGKQDLSVANSGDDSVSILLGNGDGTFTVGATPATGAGPHGIIAADFDRDGELDLAVANETDGSVSILLGNGTGTFAAKSDFAADTGSVAVAAGDFDGDGILDLAVANSGGDISILLGEGDGTFHPAVNLAIVGASPSSIAAGDFNRDGILDLAVTNRGDDTVSILLGDGSGSFDGTLFSSPFATGDAPSALVTGDFDRDGRLDVAVANKDSDNVSILLNTAPPPAVLSPAAGDAWTIATVHVIRWTYGGAGDAVNVWLSRDGGATWKTILKKTPNDGVQNWTVTGPATANAKIRVCTTAKILTCAPNSDAFTIAP